MPQVRYVGSAALIARAQAQLLSAVNLAAEDLVGQAQDKTPVATGTLRASIHSLGAAASGNAVSARVATGGEANEYAVYVHEGTSRMGGRPFLTQALLENSGRYRDFIAAAGRRAF